MAHFRLFARTLSLALLLSVLVMLRHTQHNQAFFFPFYSIIRPLGLGDSSSDYGSILIVLSLSLSFSLYPGNRCTSLITKNDNQTNIELKFDSKIKTLRMPNPQERYCSPLCLFVFIIKLNCRVTLLERSLF